MTLADGLISFYSCREVAWVAEFEYDTSPNIIFMIKSEGYKVHANEGDEREYVT